MIDRMNYEPFVGIEVENTKFKGHRTLFVPLLGDGLYTGAGYLNLLDRITVLVTHHGIDHIYLGANQTIRDGMDVALAETLAAELIDTGAAQGVTIDVQIEAARYIRQTHCLQAHIAYMVSVPDVPVGYNVYVKLDACASNIDHKSVYAPDGVWVVSTRDMRTAENFTPWSAYAEDKSA